MLVTPPPLETFRSRLTRAANAKFYLHQSIVCSETGDVKDHAGGLHVHHDENMKFYL